MRGKKGLSLGKWKRICVTPFADVVRLNTCQLWKVSARVESVKSSPHIVLTIQRSVALRSGISGWKRLLMSSICATVSSLARKFTALSRTLITASGGEVTWGPGLFSDRPNRPTTGNYLQKSPNNIVMLRIPTTCTHLGKNYQCMINTSHVHLGQKAGPSN